MTPEKGPQHAIAAAKAVDVPLILAGVIQPGQQAFFDAEIAPHLDGRRVRFVGEIGGATKRSLFAKARGLLMPIRWDEPFGMVMIEALACGTPVIAFPEGAARELVVDGETGFLVDDERGMADAICQLARLDPRDCRRWVREHCDGEVVAAAYARVYAEIALEPATLMIVPPTAERVLASA
jgi:glycosyltransferase involved in cell wall biosynthesis